jgi:hypothetical protein
MSTLFRGVLNYVWFMIETKLLQPVTQTEHVDFLKYSKNDFM